MQKVMNMPKCKASDCVVVSLTPKFEDTSQILFCPEYVSFKSVYLEILFLLSAVRHL